MKIPFSRSRILLATLVIANLTSLTAFGSSISARALEISQKDFSADAEVVSLNLDNQSVFMFRSVLETMETFSQTWPSPLSQNLKSQKVSAAEILAQPILLYRAAPFNSPRFEEYADVSGLFGSVLGVISKVQFPPAFQQSDLKIRFENALRKIHRRTLLPLAKTLAQGPGATAEDRQNWQLMEKLADQAERSQRQQAHLPLPELDASDRRAVSIFLGGFLWRFRGAGGYDNLGTNDRRAIFVQAGFASIARLNGAGTNSEAIGTALRYGVQLTSWGAYHDMGRLPGANKISDFNDMTEVGRGMTRYLKSTLPAHKQNALVSLAGGLLGSCYFYSWEKIPVDQWQVGAELKSNYLFIFGGPTNYGEFCSGAGLGLAISHILQQK